MNKKPPVTRSKKVQVACGAPDVHEMFVAGTFNNWNPRAMAMRKAPGGQWIAELDLAPGRYEYKFVADGQWCAEPGQPDDGGARPGCVSNDCGTLNRVLEVR